MSLALARVRALRFVHRMFQQHPEAVCHDLFAHARARASSPPQAVCIDRCCCRRSRWHVRGRYEPPDRPDYR